MPTVEEETKQWLLFTTMITALILGAVGFLLSVLLLLYAVYLTSLAVAAVAVFVLVLSTALGSLAYVWFVNA